MHTHSHIDTNTWRSWRCVAIQVSFFCFVWKQISMASSSSTTASVWNNSQKHVKNIIPCYLHLFFIHLVLAITTSVLVFLHWNSTPPCNRNTCTYMRVHNGLNMFFRFHVCVRGFNWIIIMIINIYQLFAKTLSIYYFQIFECPLVYGKLVKIEKKKYVIIMKFTCFAVRICLRSCYDVMFVTWISLKLHYFLIYDLSKFVGSF